ncbi:cytochrome b [Agarivorans sp. Toyoura001]|uniref:cytochrome b n=1 Tax=Agarivorans sp. Toyoura001 TaxID=2283141 RepID=UPI0010D7AA7F|nr:cytochrome b [Agarivorans sp. Toyoura001]GDY25621.1 cytochrome b [Agarivorans sp. Toyoura001]
MNVKNNSTQFGLVSKLIHWLMAALIIALVAIALYMDTLPRGAEKSELFSLHKGLGVIALASIFLRIIWHRITKVPSPIGEGIKLKMAHAGHLALYLLMLAMPISGMIMSLAGGHAINFFDLFTIAGFAEKNEWLNGIASEVHYYAAQALYVTLAAHVGAALYHHFLLKDDTIKRMTSK